MANDTGALVVDVFGKLAVVVLLMLACAAGWKKLQSAASQKAGTASHGIQVANTVALAPQRFLHIVNVGERQLLVASTPQQISLIAPLHGAEDAVLETVASPPGEEDGTLAQDRFDYLLRRLQEIEEVDRTGATPGAEMENPEPIPTPRSQGTAPRNPARPRRPQPEALQREESPPPFAAGSWSGAIAPGSLFRNSSETAGANGRTTTREP